MRLFDTHCDTAGKILSGEPLSDRAGPVSLARAAAFAEWRQVFAFCCEAPPRTDDGLWQALSDKLAAFRAACPELRFADRDGLSAAPLAILGVEGCEQLPLGASPAAAAFAAGVRVFGITWNYDNRFAGCAAASGGGMTAEGRALAAEIGDLGGVIDVSHISEAAFDDLCAQATPFFASHSNARALCDHPRNLADGQLRALAARGAPAGVNFYVPFLTDRPRATVGDVCDHVIYLSEFLGETGVGVGADFDGCGRLPEGLSAEDEMENLADALLARGFTARHVDGILHDNMYAFFARSLKESL